MLRMQTKSVGAVFASVVHFGAYQAIGKYWFVEFSAIRTGLIMTMVALFFCMAIINSAME